MSPHDRVRRAGQGEPGDDAGAGADAERDAWLREALRHAPDTAAAAPPALREAILAQARAATRAPSPRRASAASSGSAFWAWLARPPVASGFAGLMAATLVGLMWWDQPMDLASPAPATPTAPPTAQVDPAPAAAAPAPAAPTPSPSARVAPRAADASRATEEVLARQVPRAEAGTTANDSRSAAKARRADAEPKPFASDAPAPVPPAATAAPATEAPAAPAPTTVAPAPLQAAPLRERQELATGTTRSKAAPEPFATTPAPAGQAADRSEQAERATRDAARDTARTTRQTSVDASRPLDPLLAALTADPSRWSRQAAGGEARPLDEATRRWVADFDAATRNRWQGALAGAAAVADAGPASAAAPSLVLLLDGRPAAVFRVDGAQVLYESRLEGPARPSRAALGAAEAARLATTVPR